MANITIRGISPRMGRSHRVRTATAQATVGQTDWIKVPNWANWMRVTVNITAMTGTTPALTPTLITPADAGNASLGDVANPGTAATAPTDTAVVQLGGAVLTSGFTAAGTAVISVGPGVTGIANDVALGTSGVNYAYINDILPDILGISIVNFRGSSDETYTYTVDVLFRDN